MKPKVALSVTIDTECDKGARWRTTKPLAFRGIHDGVHKRLDPLFLRYGAKATYLLSPEVLRDSASVAVLAKLRPRAELGTHLHGELAEPHAFVPSLTRVFQRDYPEAVERAKMTSLTEDFKAAFGTAPKSFRAGRFGIGPNTVPILEDLGYVVESSVTPGVDWTSSGAPGLAFMGAPTQPYHPDPRSPGHRGHAKLLEVPVTIRKHRLGALPTVGKYIEPRWLRPTHGSKERIVDVAREEIRAAQRSHHPAPVILCAMFHNVEIVPNASPYASTERAASAILGRLDALLAFAAREGIPTIGLTDVAELLQ